MEKIELDRALDKIDVRRRNQAYGKANRESIRAQKRQYYLRNRETMLQKEKARWALMSEGEKAARLAAMATYNAATAGQRREAAIRYRAENKIKVLEAQRAAYGEKREVRLAKKAEYYLANKEKITAYKKLYQLNSGATIAAANEARAGLVRMATPPWANMKEMNAIYRQAKTLSSSTGVKHNVDHVIPLKHKDVCGLHCTANLQVLTELANKRKNNKFTSDWSEYGPR